MPIAFFDAGGVVLALFPWHLLAADAMLPHLPKPAAFRGITLACMCRSDAEVDVLMTRAVDIGARLLKPAQHTSFGGYSGYFADPDDHTWEVVRAPGLPPPMTGVQKLPDEGFPRPSHEPT